LLDTGPLDPEAVNLVRFNLWCSQHGHTFARIYWRHDGEHQFHDAQSVTIPLNGSASAWQEYAVRLDRPDKKASWYEGGPIVALRFDPINVPGLVCLGELALCKQAH
jgi:hypothetical protein